VVRIGLDARTLTSPRPRGTGRNLLDAYRLIPQLRPDWQFVLYHQRPLDDRNSTPDAPWHLPNVRLRHIDLRGDRFDAWFQLRLPVAMRHDRIDLAHFPASAAPRWCPLPFVVTIHDLIPLQIAGEATKRDAERFRRGVLRAARGAAHLICPSDATRATLTRTCGVQPAQVSVIPWAPDEGIVAEARNGLSARRRQQLRDQYGLAQRWLVTFSGNTPRKNARGLLRALPLVPASAREPDAPWQVVFIGCEPATCREDLAAQAKRFGISERVRILGFVPYRDLPGLLRGASGLLMPSRAEGFGLPILDAFACGVPVLTSAVSSMPEVAGDAAIYCDPDNPASIATGITELLSPDVAARLVPRGYARLANFSWPRTAEAMCVAYERGLAQRGTPATCRMSLEGTR
jgi:glycosyltransferase involved in cell wall biosynthesis